MDLNESHFKDPKSLYTWTDHGLKLDLDSFSTGNIVLDIVRVSSIAPRGRSQHYVLGKCTEELGEIATVVNKPDVEHPEPLEGEVADLIISAVDLLYVHYRDKHPELSDNELKIMVYNNINNVYYKKLSKWKDNIKNNSVQS